MSLNPAAAEWKPSASAAVFVPASVAATTTPPPAADPTPEAEAEAAAAAAAAAAAEAEAAAAAEAEAAAAAAAEAEAAAAAAAKAEAAAAAEAEAAAAAAAEAAGDDANAADGGDGEAGASSSAKKAVVSERAEKHVNIVFIGHVDAGKSTISGHIMYLTGGLDQRTLDKYEREAKANSRESWKYAWAMDTTEQERDRGKTVEVGRASFSTGSKRFTILDAPGHKAYIPHMIGGASQADVGVLVVSSRKGEFETGFDRGGQTREHAMLAKTAGVKQLIVVINKMDDESVNWSKDRFMEIVKKIKPYLKGVGYSKSDLVFMPVSGLAGYNLKEPIPEGLCPWYKGPPLLTLLEQLRPPQRLMDAALRLPIADSYRDMGVVVMGKLEAGTIANGANLVLMPNQMPVEVIGLWIDEYEVEVGEPGDNLKIKLKGVDEGDVKNGFVLCEPDNLVSYVTEFEAQVMLLDITNILAPGFKCILHVHACVEEVEFAKLVSVIDRKTGDVVQTRPRFGKQGQTIIARLKTEQPICVETYADFAQLGRFMLRDEGKTIAVGVIKSLGKKKKRRKNKDAAAASSS